MATSPPRAQEIPKALRPLDADHLRQQLALIVGFNTTTGKVQPIGTGIVVGFPVPYVLTAAHLLFGFTDALLGPAPHHPLSPTIGGREPEAENSRLARVLGDHKIQAVVEAPNGDMHAFELSGVSSAMGPKMIDIALLRLNLRDDWFKTHSIMAPLIMDFAEIDRAETYLMAGFEDMPSLDFDEQDRVVEMRARSKFLVRECRIDEVTTPPHDAHPDLRMWKVLTPSEPGMSGGPLVRIRRPWGSREIVPGIRATFFTAVGVTSHGMTEGADVPYTWISPVQALRLLPSEMQAGVSASLNIDAMIITYQDMERRLATIDPSHYYPEAMHSLEPFRIYQEKGLHVTAPLINAYLQLLERGPPFDIASLPAEKQILAPMLGLRFFWTTDDAGRALLERAMLALPQFQPIGLAESERAARVAAEEQMVRDQLPAMGKYIPGNE